MSEERRWRLLGAWIVLFTLTTGWGLREFRTDHKALCAFKAAHANTLRKSQKFLLRYPHGIDGISAELIQSGIKDDEATLKSLSVLSC